MTDITFVNPVLDECFPIGLGQLAAYLRHNGLKVEVVDTAPQRLSPATVAEKVLVTKPRVLGLTGLWAYYPFIKKVSLDILAQNKNLTQIAGGYWSSPCPDLVMKDTGVSAVVHGEGEETVLQLVKAIIDKRHFSEVEGISFMQGNNLIKTKTRVPVSDVNTLLWPAYDRFDMHYYVREQKIQDFKWNASDLTGSAYLSKKDIYHRLGKKGTVRQATMFTSRGCMGRCTFCSLPAFGLRFRMYDPKYIVDHMRFLRDAYGADIFEITESLTLVDKKRTRALCRAIINARLNTFFVAVARGDLELDCDTAQLLKEAGCYLVRIGFESANKYILNSVIRKHASVDKYHQTTARLHAAGIRVNGSFILNMPGETEESIRDTYKFVRKSKLDDGSIFYANPLPGTWLFDYSEQYGFIRDRWRIINENPGINKGLSDFETYIRNFNFNKLPKGVLIGYRHMIVGTLMANRNMKMGGCLRGAIAYASIKLLEIVFLFPWLRHRFHRIYGYIIVRANVDLTFGDIVKRALKKVRLQ